ncbi:MAG: exosortase/archaeosortase family protein [Lentisphaeria bacterium]|nr:exosortase/archaeosortase family protein [Lentisphaeria bacterium]
MNIKSHCKDLWKHPPGVLYSTLLGLVAFSAAVPMFSAGAWDSALVDLIMAAMLIFLMLKNLASGTQKTQRTVDKYAAWALVVSANILALVPAHEFPGSLSTAFAFSSLICAFVLYFSGAEAALLCTAPALWCCVFIPYHSELMLLLSYPLRLSATMLSGVILRMLGIGAVYQGTSLTLPGLNIAITDACSGINQLDAFILIAFIAVRMMQSKTVWKIVHFSFIVPSIIIGNSLRIALTVILFRIWGECVLQDSWHTALGYVQIILAFAIFLAAGRIFSADNGKEKEQEKC